MVINNKEINLKITPTALRKIEEKYEDFDILKLLRDIQEQEKEPRMSDYYKLVYTGYLGATGEEIDYDDFLKLIEDIDMLEINKVGVNLLLKRKN
jgi:hypothetical protein|nr:MAG TPA: tail tube protein [Caudoviricetes sp.]